jgi:hypothetical protein
MPKIWERIKAAYNGKDCKAMDEALAELKAKDEDPDGGGTAVHVHTNEGGRTAYDDDTLKGLFEKNDTDHKAMDERMAACEGMMKSANDARMKDEAAAKEKEDADKAKDAEKEKEENEIKDALADEAPAGEEEKAKTAKDSSFLVESFQHTKAKAEIIAPGIQFPAFDKAASAKDSYKSICDLRKRAIISGAKDSKTLALILSLQGGKAFDSTKFGNLHCSQVKTLFDSLSHMKKLENNAAATKNKPDMNAINPGNDGIVKDAESFKNAREKARKERGQNIN